MKKENKYDLTDVSLAGNAVWSGGEMLIPAIGDKVKVTMNKLGTGVVESYFVEHGEECGYLGVCVKLDNPPDWHMKQSPLGSKYHRKALVFGREITKIS